MGKNKSDRQNFFYFLFFATSPMFTFDNYQWKIKSS